MRRETGSLEREALLEQMRRLACAKVNDAVKLAYLPEEERDAIGRLDLAALTEFRRSGAGTVEMKFTDRMRALERLLELSGPSGEEQLERFLQRMEDTELWGPCGFLPSSGGSSPGGGQAPPTPATTPSSVRGRYAAERRCAPGCPSSAGP